MRASLASLAKRVTPAISPSSLAAVRTPQPRSASSLGASAATSVREFGLEVVDGAGELADAAQLVARDADARALLGAREATGDARLPAGGGQRARRDLGLGPEVVQVPAQVVAQRGALRDEPLAVIDEQPDVELGAGQLRDGQRVEAFAQRGARDRDGVDERRTCRDSRADCARADGELGRDADDGFAAGEQEPLQRAGDVPAVLDRPDTLARRRGCAPSASRASKDRWRADTVRSPSTRPIAASTAATVCERLCVSAPITIIALALPFGWSAESGSPADTSQSRPKATHLSSHAGDPRTAAGDTTSAGQTTAGRQKVNESARRRPEDLPAAPDATARPPGLWH